MLVVVCCLGLVAGCSQSSKEPEKPKIITNKIIQNQGSSVSANEMKKPEVVIPEPAKEKAVGGPSEALKKKIDQGKPPDMVSALEGKGKDTEIVELGSYDPKGKTDPFEPLFKQETAAQEKRKRTRTGPLTPLERVDLSQLKLVGVILASGGNTALIQEASGKGFVIKNGTKIGINSGKVIQILKDRIIVEEEVEDIYGNLKVQKREMTLQKPPGD
jgi:type IV pilus assembly protein PilP